MIVSVDVSAASVIKWLKDGHNRHREAISQSLNDVMVEAQKKERAHVKSAFIVRKEQFTLRQAAIIKFAKPDQLWAKIFVGKKKRHFLYEFERGGDRLSQRELRRLGVNQVGVPRAARPTPQSIVAEPDWISNLKLVKQQRRGDVGQPRRQDSSRNRIWRAMRTAAKIRYRAGASDVFVGERGTFLIQGYGIYQRVKDVVKKLYLLTTRPVRLPARLRFIDTAKTEATKFTEILQKRIKLAYTFKGGTP